MTNSSAIARCVLLLRVALWQLPKRLTPSKQSRFGHYTFVRRTMCITGANATDHICSSPSHIL